MDALDPVLRADAPGPSSMGPAQGSSSNPHESLRPQWQSTQSQTPQTPTPTHMPMQNQQPVSDTNTRPVGQIYEQSATAISPQTPTSATTAVPTPSTTAALGPSNNASSSAAVSPAISGPVAESPALTPPNPEPTTLASGQNASTSTNANITDPVAGTDPNKKPRACEACRALKVRCDFPDPDAGPPCKRCLKTKKQCVVTQPSRKRTKKTDSRVAELEKRIDALTAGLHAGRGLGEWSATRGLQHQHHQQQQPEEGGRHGPQAAPPLSSPAVTAPAGAQKRKFDDFLSGEREREKERERESERGRGEEAGVRELAMAGPQPAVGFGGVVEAGREPRPVADVVDRGILTTALAGELFVRYTTRMCQHLPGVVFSPGTTAAELRATKPILFLAIMAAASSEMPALQRTLTRELMQVFAEKIIVIGAKSLELVQAIQVAVIWYWPPERFEELKFYQLVHVAAVMAIEIGLGRKKQAKGGFRKHISYAWRDHPLRKHTPPDPTTIEARRAWLTCYFLATNTAMALHRTNLIRWTPFIAECMDVLESSPDAAPTDKYLCHLVWTHKLAEEVGIQFSMDDPVSTPNIADPRTQYALRGFEHQLEKYSSSIQRELQQRTLSTTCREVFRYADCSCSIVEDELSCSELIHARDRYSQ